ncbi:MAG: hypothetical protein AAFQ41_15705 [Cyanobacteria bacterium J06623_7]
MAALVNEASINEQGDRDRGIVSIEYGDGTWVATLDDLDITGRNTASVRSDFDDIISAIDRRDGQNFDLVDLEYGDGEWIARFEDNPGESTYTTSEDFETFRTEIEAQAENGFDLIDVEYAEDAWFGVFRNVDNLPTENLSIEEVAEPVSSTTTPGSIIQPTFNPPPDFRFNTVLGNNARVFNNLNF